MWATENLPRPQTPTPSGSVRMSTHNQISYQYRNRIVSAIDMHGVVCRRTVLRQQRLEAGHRLRGRLAVVGVVPVGRGCGVNPHPLGVRPYVNAQSNFLSVIRAGVLL